MVNKRNSKLLRKMLTAIAGSLILGNCSTVWMMEPPKKSFNDIKNEFQTTRNAIQNAEFAARKRRWGAIIKNAIKNKIPNNIYRLGFGQTVEVFSENATDDVLYVDTLMDKATIEPFATEASALILEFINSYSKMISKFSK